MVGRAGLEPATLRLSGVRSNHLSYRPPLVPERPQGRGRRKPAQARQRADPGGDFPVMKGHEDDGMFFEEVRSTSGCETRRFRTNP